MSHAARAPEVPVLVTWRSSHGRGTPGARGRFWRGARGRCVRARSPSVDHRECYLGSDYGVAIPDPERSLSRKHLCGCTRLAVLAAPNRRVVLLRADDADKAVVSLDLQVQHASAAFCSSNSASRARVSFISSDSRAEVRTEGSVLDDPNRQRLCGQQATARGSAESLSRLPCKPPMLLTAPLAKLIRPSP